MDLRLQRVGHEAGLLSLLKESFTSLQVASLRQRQSGCYFEFCEQHCPFDSVQRTDHLTLKVCERKFRSRSDRSKGETKTVGHGGHEQVLW
jgi:hypothetical protein